MWISSCFIFSFPWEWTLLCASGGKKRTTKSILRVYLKYACASINNSMRISFDFFNAFSCCCSQMPIWMPILLDFSVVKIFFLYFPTQPKFLLTRITHVTLLQLLLIKKKDIMFDKSAEWTWKLSELNFVSFTMCGVSRASQVQIFHSIRISRKFLIWFFLTLLSGREWLRLTNVSHP